MTSLQVPNLPPRDLSLYYHSKLFPTIDSFEFKNDNTLLNVLHHNARSLPKRLVAYSTLKIISNTDIFCVSETFLKPYHPDSCCTLPNFVIERCDRMSSNKKKQGGGSAILLRNNLQYKRLNNLTELLQPVCDSVWLEVSTRKSKPLIVASIYRPPDTEKDMFTNLLTDAISTYLPDCTDLIIMGDININWRTPSKAKTQMANAASILNLKQVISSPTYNSNEGKESTIDLSFVSTHLSLVSSGAIVSDLSDHYFIHTSVKVKPQKSARRLIHTRSYNKLNYDSLFNSAAHIPFHTITQVYDCPHTQAQTLEKYIETLLDSHIPRRIIRVRDSRPIWLTTELLKLIRLKNKFFKKIYKHAATHPTQNQINHYKKFRNMVTQKIRTQKRCILQQELTKDTSTFYKCARKLIGSKNSSCAPIGVYSGNDFVTDDLSIAESFNSFFSKTVTPPKTLITPKEPNGFVPQFSFDKVSTEDVSSVLTSLKDKTGGVSQIPASIYKLLAPLIINPLTTIINNCIESEVFPDCFKIGLITPVHKKGNKTFCENYRPISSLPILSKVFEKLLYKQLNTHLANHDLLSDRQYGFRKNHSSQQMILSLIEPWLKAFDSPSPCYISALSLDITKAFDSINHDYLIALLPTFGISIPSSMLLASYLANRKQIVKIGSSFSSPALIQTGVPQGSILGPLMFNLVVNGLLNNINDAMAYADDTILFALGETQIESLRKITKTLEQATKWYKSAGLNLNVNKTKYCVFSNRSVDKTLQLKYLDSTLSPDNTLKLLGVILDSKLTMSDHCQSIVNKTSGTISLLGKCRKYLELPQALQIYTSIIRPRFEYCPLLLTALSKHDSYLLEKCQNRALRIILQAPTAFSMTDGRIMLNIHTLSSRRQYFFAKTIDYSLPKKKLSAKLLSLLDNQSTRKSGPKLRNPCQLILPNPRTFYGKRTFTYCAIKHKKSTKVKPTNFLSFYITP